MKMVMFEDYTGIVRAWAIAPTEEQAEARAREELAFYCARQVGLEPALADPNDYTRRVTNIEGEQ